MLHGFCTFTLTTIATSPNVFKLPEVVFVLSDKFAQLFGVQKRQDPILEGEVFRAA